MTVSDLHIIQSIFDHPLPGRSAHAVMAKNLGRADIVTPDNARYAAVMILLYPNDQGDLELVLTERSVTHPGDSHSGQMSFPGGKRDPEDRDLQYTALRETWEEVGVDVNAIQILGATTPVYIPVSNFLAHPYVGYVSSKPTFIAEEREVAEIVVCSLADLLAYEEPSAIDIAFKQGLTLKDVPYFDVKGKVVWGATSMMLNEFLIAIRQREAALQR